MSKKAVGVGITVAALGAVAIGVWLNFDTIKDTFLANTYQPSDEIVAIEDKLKFTDRGKQIFRASQPALENQKEFNEHCNSHNTEVSVLGCYTGTNIYLYRVQQSDLQGVVETTAAHETLHAVWARMSNEERDRVGTMLDSYYASHQQQLSKEMDMYSADQRLDELHARVGTEGKDLPSDLKDHYAEYFTDQAQIVSYYDSYHGRLQELYDESKRLRTEIDTLRVKIDEESQEYQTRSAALAHEISAFNSCADTTGCFKSQSEFNTKRAALVQEQKALELLYNQINQSIYAYNAKVTAYNNNVFRTQELQNSINSNIQPQQVEKGA